MKEAAKPTARDILISVQGWQQQLWPVWNLENKIEIFANGGVAPMEDTEDSVCLDDTVPLGVAKQFMQKQLDALTDPLYIKPGVIQALYHCPENGNPERKQPLETGLNTELNNITGSQLDTEITQAAGRLTVTGRCAVYRRSPNDWLGRNGRIIHPSDYGINPLDSSWREWAFPGKINLQEIEERIKSSDPNVTGWQKSALEKLKLWIMAAEAKKYPNNVHPTWGEFSPENWLNLEIYGTFACSPVDVYWYFRKNGKWTEDDSVYGGQEEVDLYCISRFGQTARVAEDKTGNGVDKWLDINLVEDKDFQDQVQKYRRAGNENAACELEDNERALFHCPGLFKGVDECLIFGIDDARVAGEQLASEVRGVGRSAMPKLAVLEGLLSAVIEGITFAAQPNWSITGAVGEADRRQLERGGSRSWEVWPQSVQPMVKNNITSGFRDAMGLIQTLDTSIAADSRVSGQPTLGGAQSEFAAQAQAQLSEKAQGAARRQAKWIKMVVDKCVMWAATTLCRPEEDQKKAFPCYWDAKRLRDNLKKEYKITEKELDPEYWTFKTRELSGNMQRDQVVAMSGAMMQLAGPVFPSAMQFFAREALRAVYGDNVVNELLNPPKKEVQDQARKALNNVTTTYVAGVPVTPDADADPMVNLTTMMGFAATKLAAFQKTGTQTHSEQSGMAAVFTYGFPFIAQLPEQLRQPVAMKMAELAKMGASVPAQAPPKEGALTEKDKLDAQIKMENNNRLKEAADKNYQLKEINTFANLRKAGQTEKAMADQQQTNAVNRAKTTLDMAEQIGQAATVPQEPMS